MPPRVVNRPPHHMVVTPPMREAARLSAKPFAEAVRHAQVSAGDGALVVAWLSDMHIHAPRQYDSLGWAYSRAVDCSANLDLALAEVGELSPDLVIFGGDLADSGCAHEAPPDEYAEFGRVLDAHLPREQDSLAILGNHDHADQPLTPAWHTAFAAMAPAPWPATADASGDDYFHVAHRHGWRFIGLDSRQGGALPDTQRIWLKQQLESDAASPTVMLTHRPLTCCGNWVDDHRLIDRKLFDLLDGADCVRAVLSGHTHRAAGWRYREKTHVIFPSVAYGIPDPVGWGAVVLSGNDVAAAFVKDITVDQYYDCVADDMSPSLGTWRQLDRRPFVRDMRFNPCLLPR